MIDTAVNKDKWILILKSEFLIPELQWSIQKLIAYNQLQLSPTIGHVLFNLMLTLYSFNLLSRVLLLSISFASTRPLNAPPKEFFKADTRQLALRLSQSAKLRAELASLGRSDVLETNVEDYGSSVEPKQELVNQWRLRGHESVAPKEKDYTCNNKEYYFGEELGAKIALNVDFESRLTHCQLVNRRGFFCEEHYTTTADSYILGLFRIGPLSRVEMDTAIFRKFKTFWTYRCRRRCRHRGQWCFWCTGSSTARSRGSTTSDSRASLTRTCWWTRASTCGSATCTATSTRVTTPLSSQTRRPSGGGL